MNKSIKTLAVAAVASVMLLACDDKPSASAGDDNSSPQKQVTPYDPPMLSIDDEVIKWMEEQLASKGEEKRLIVISDMYMPGIEVTALSATIDADGKTEYFFNDNKISFEEYQSKWEYERERANLGKRALSIPGKIISDDNNDICWMVLMTAEEFAELLAKEYDKLAIRFYVEPVEE